MVSMFVTTHLLSLVHGSPPHRVGRPTLEPNSIASAATRKALLDWVNTPYPKNTKKHSSSLYLMYAGFRPRRTRYRLMRPKGRTLCSFGKRAQNHCGLFMVLSENVQKGLISKATGSEEAEAYRHVRRGFRVTRTPLAAFFNIFLRIPCEARRLRLLRNSHQGAQTVLAVFPDSAALLGQAEGRRSDKVSLRSAPLTQPINPIGSTG